MESLTSTDVIMKANATTTINQEKKRHERVYYF